MCNVFHQVLLTAPGNSSGDSKLYAAAQRYLDGFVETTINSPLPAGVLNGSDAELGRTAGVPWVMPAPKPPAGEVLSILHESDKNCPNPSKAMALLICMPMPSATQTQRPSRWS